MFPHILKTKQKNIFFNYANMRIYKKTNCDYITHTYLQENYENQQQF